MKIASGIQEVTFQGKEVSFRQERKSDTVKVQLPLPVFVTGDFFTKIVDILKPDNDKEASLPIHFLTFHPKHT